ncbi:diiron oxygenase [Kitasatospora sp. NPDC048540]|uniref:diiron oxygenase n=1 Tax=unclassified Kitasatospora TaxID=2633591 RepID=UPI000539EFEF|nr:diiron oxygenase [Kitasatospora sp. MBT63]
MCGIVGLFVGCTALSYCPKQLLAGTPAAAPDGAAGYRSPFRNWHERASVRQAPRRVLADDEGDRHYFSPDLVAIAQHPLVKELPPACFEEVLVQHLYRYLEFTARLEYLVVNRTVLGIARGSIGVHLPEEMRFDAYKMYCDEAYHTLFSVDLSRQVRQRTGIVPKETGEPYFLVRLQQILAELPAGDRALAEVLFVIVSETLISASLAEVPERADVVAAVRSTVRDHASDEGRHHAYFATFLRHLWGQLSPRERRTAGLLVPRLVDAFLRPDLPAIRLELAGYGLSAADAEQVAAETYTPGIIGAHLAATSRQTVHYFQSLGAFDDPAALDELRRYGMVA